MRTMLVMTLANAEGKASDRVAVMVDQITYMDRVPATDHKPERTRVHFAGKDNFIEVTDTPVAIMATIEQLEREGDPETPC